MHTPRMEKNITYTQAKENPSTVYRISSFFILGLLCLSISLPLYLISFYALLDFFHYPLYSDFLDSPLITPLVLSSLACILPPLFLIDTCYSFFERTKRIFEIQSSLFLLLFIILSFFCYYTLQQDDKMASVLYAFYFAGISRLLICLYLYISIRLCLASQNLVPLHKLNIEHQQMPTILDRSLLVAQISGILLMTSAFFPLPFLDHAEFLTSFIIFALFFLFFYIIFQLRIRPYKIWRIPYILVNTTFFIYFAFYETLAWQILLAVFYLYQCFVFYCLYKKSEKWFL